MRCIAGHIELSSQMYAAVRRLQDAEAELRWTAHHYDEATPRQRARLDAHIAAIERYEDE